ncbi:MAG: autotransporter outer membrane beta-barrel domain-containing protein, partial [Akkermansia muciniphila]|nr:autotransporter outer membrane beta-barrel domain-containing protein [Akkermansia muciniphila]
MKLHLPKGLRAALLACLALASIGVTKADPSIISINFATGDDVNVKTDAPGSVGGVSASGWMNILGNSASAISKTYTALTDQSGAAVSGFITLKTQQNPWSPSGNRPYTTLSDQIQRSYLDLGGNNTWTINLLTPQDTDVCVISDLVLYFSGDGKKFSPVSVNGISYVGGVDAVAGEDVTDWGNRDMSVSGAYGNDTINAKNTIKVTGLSGYISTGNVPQNNSDKRATLAGMQIILDDTEQLFYSSDLALVASEAASNLTWKKDGVTSALADIELSARYLNFTNGTDATTVTFSDESVRVIEVSSGNLTLAGTLSAETLFAKKDTVLNLAGKVSENGNLSVGGQGAVNFKSSTSFKDLILYGAGEKVFSADVTVDGVFYAVGTTVRLESGVTLDASKISFDRTSAEANLASVSGDGLLKLKLGNNANSDKNELITSDTTSPIDINVNVTFVGEGELALVGTLRSEDTLNINAGKSLTIANEKGALRVKRSTLNVNGSLNAYYIQLGHETAGDHPGVINLYEGGSLKATEIEFCNAGSGKDSVFMMSGGVLEFTQNTNSAFSNTTGAKGIVKLHGGTLKAESSSWFVNTDKTVEVGGVSVETVTDKTITLNNIKLVGNISTSGNLVLAGTSTGVGSLSVQTGGNLTVSGDVTLGATIENGGVFTLDTAKGGKLSFTSKDVLTKNAVDYLDNEKSTTSGNGYASGTFYIVKPTSDSTGITTSGIKKVSVAGIEKDVIDSVTENGCVSITGDEALKGLYYIRLGGTFEYGSGDNNADNELTTGLILDTVTTSPLTLVMKTNLHENAVKNDGIIVRSNATIQLDTGVSLNKVTIDTGNDGTADIPRLTLIGGGTYVMDKATGLDADATKVGTGSNVAVQVTNTELGGNGDDKFYITALNKLGSDIEISGLSGYAYDGAAGATTPKSPKVTVDLELTGTALTLTDAPDEKLTGGTLTLSGKLSGTGSIVNNSKGNVSLGGDISGWEGSYTASEAGSVLTLAADAKLNASVTGGSVTLEGALTLGKTMSLSGNLNLAEIVDLDSGKYYSTINLCERALTDEAGVPTGAYEMPSISVDGKAVGNASDGILNFTMGSTNFLKSLSDGGEFVLLSAKGGITGYSRATLDNKDFFTDGDVRYYVELGATSVTLSKVTLGLQWEGKTTDGWTATTGFGQSSPLNENSIVSFTGGGSATVAVKGNQVVKGINVDTYRDPASPEGPDFVDTYTFTGDSITTDTLGIVHGRLVVQNELKVNNLTSIHTGTTLTVCEGGSLTSDGMSNNGTLSIGEGSVVTVNTLTGDGAVSGDGKLVVQSGSVSASTLGSNTGTIVMNSLKDSDATTVGGTLLVRQSGSYTGAYKEKTSIGTTDASATQALRADANLTVIGDAGTVSLTSLDNTVAAANKLGGINTKGETVLLNNVRDDVAADGTTTKVPTTVTLGSASRMEKGVLDFTVSAAAVNDSLTSADKPVVTTGAALSLKDVTLKVHEVQNKDLGITTGGQEKDIVLFVVNDTANDCEVDNVNVNMDDCPWMTKYFTNFRVVEGSVNVIGDANTGRYAAHGQTPNGTAGLALAGKAMFHVDPQTQNPDGELAQVLDMLDAHIESGNKGAMDKLGAALAGSSLSAVGLALADDVQRQLRSIRNRTTTMGVNECVVNEDMPYVNGWISGDGNYRQLSESGTDAGYQLSSWGGTVGVDVDENPNLTLGVAVSALFGDYTGKAADTLTGDLDTQYVSLFARVSTGSWVNTFVGTLGRADVDLERTIPGVTGKTTYKTNGMMFGFLYEVARTFALNEDASTCVQPLFNISFSHTSLDSATEGGTADTRLTTDSASLTQFSLGLGGRLQSIVGENEYNRASIFEARALLKLDFGDRYNKLNTALAALPTATVSTRSNEKGVIGAEVGASLTIPISQDAGSVFFDVNADFNADQTGVNGSVGYRI